MELEFKGGNCVVINHRKDTFVTDPNLSAQGLKDQGRDATVQLLTQEKFAAAAGEDTLVIDGPGEYEVHNCSIKGIAARAYADAEGTKTATIFRIELEDIAVAVVGHITPDLSEEQLEAIGVIDVLVLPIGDQGQTLDAKQAVALVKEIDPKAVIPTDFDQSHLDEFTTELGAQAEAVPKLKLKAGQLPEQLAVYQLSATK